MTDEELVRKLRDLDTWVETADIPDLAADRIEQLIAERDQWIAHTKNAVWADSEELKLAEAERDRLREALTRLLAPFGNDTCHYDHHGYCQEHFIEADCCVAHARAALKGETP